MTSYRIAACAWVVALCACSTAAEQGSSWQAPTDGVQNVSSGTEAEKFFPMVDGNIYHFRTESFGDSPAAESGMLMMKVHRSSATQGELRRPAGSQTFEYTKAGIATKTKAGAPAFLLKVPLSPDLRWLGPHGGDTRISAMEAAVTTPAGSFTGCLTTVEERRGDQPLKVTTTLCPDVGITTLQVESGGVVERAQLVYYGPPIDLGPEGLRRVD
jgi:hypothetical protein